MIKDENATLEEEEEYLLLNLYYQLSELDVEGDVS